MLTSATKLPLPYDVANSGFVVSAELSNPNAGDTIINSGALVKGYYCVDFDFHISSAANKKVAIVIRNAVDDGDIASYTVHGEIDINFTFEFHHPVPIDTGQSFEIRLVENISNGDAQGIITWSKSAV